jgi:curli production assembly/transport component CsgG
MRVSPRQDLRPSLAKLATIATAVAILSLLAGCAVSHPPSEPSPNAQLSPVTPITRDLMKLPPPKGKVIVAVYGFRDQTGQYKSAPDSSFSTAVTQGASSLLVKALRDSGWYTLVERENLQDLLTERKIIRAMEAPQGSGDARAQPISIPPLMPAAVLVEGGVVAYESNVRSGGGGARILGIGASSQYRVDQVTVNLRLVDIRRGVVLNSVSTTKTIYSYEIKPSVFRFVNFKDLLELEFGITRNEPAQLCLNQAIEAAVLHLVVQGIQSGLWALKNEKDWNDPLVQKYLRDNSTQYGLADTGPEPAGQGPDLSVPGPTSPAR